MKAFALRFLAVLTILGIGFGVHPVGAMAQDTAADQAPAEKPAVIKIAAMGDIMLGTVGHLPADNAKGAFANVKPYLKGRDIIFGNQEGVLADSGACVKKGENPYCFRSPSSYAKVYKDAGFNMLSIANNHVNDFGAQAKKEMIATLNKLGIPFSGPPGTVARVNVRGVKVAMIAFYSGSGSNPLTDIPKAKKLVKKLASTEDVVIVSFHGGAEGAKAKHVKVGDEHFMGEYRGDVVGFSRAVVDAGADLVVGHGPHVPRAAELYKGRLIAYSLGNFCTAKRINIRGINGYAPLLLVELEKNGKFAGGRIVGFTQGYDQHPKFDSQNKAGKLMYDLGREDLPKSTAVKKDGTLISPGRSG